MAEAAEEIPAEDRVAGPEAGTEDGMVAEVETAANADKSAAHDKVDEGPWVCACTEDADEESMEDKGPGPTTLPDERWKSGAGVGRMKVPREDEKAAAPDGEDGAECTPDGVPPDER